MSAELKQCPLFAGMKEEDIKKVRAIASPKTVGKKGLLFAEGEEAKGF